MSGIWREEWECGSCGHTATTVGPLLPTPRMCPDCDSVAFHRVAADTCGVLDA